jgi:hypothetical protein
VRNNIGEDFAARGGNSCVQALSAYFEPCYFTPKRSPLICLQLKLAVTIKALLRYTKLLGVVPEAVTVADVR